ncbi:hypothetical protein, partial [Streptococcus pyogenes]|uniref:hypothetical protein n=1 Tax=Streptococcus pyogenes TaxID=1314 RepID=UPI003DA0BC83
IPAREPKIKANIVLVIGLNPFVINFAKINAPKGKVPSTDISGKSNILYVINTPIARTANISPCSSDIVINEFI